jgi:hypothetical protein
VALAARRKDARAHHPRLPGAEHAVILATGFTSRVARLCLESSADALVGNAEIRGYPEAKLSGLLGALMSDVKAQFYLTGSKSVKDLGPEGMARLIQDGFTKNVKITGKFLDCLGPVLM